MVEIVLPRAVGSQGPAGPMGPGATDQQVASVVTPIVDAKTSGKADKDGSNVEADAFRGAIRAAPEAGRKSAADFGAVGDGIADDSAALAAAFASGYTIVLGKAHYIGSQIVLAGDVRIEGVLTTLVPPSESIAPFITSNGCNLTLSGIIQDGYKGLLCIGGAFGTINISNVRFVGVSDSVDSLCIFSLSPQTGGSLRVTNSYFKDCTPVFLDNLSNVEIVFNDNEVVDGVRHIVRALPQPQVAGPDDPGARCPRRIEFLRNTIRGVNTSLSDKSTIARVLQADAKEEIVFGENDIYHLNTTTTGTVVYWGFGSLTLRNNKIRRVEGGASGTGRRIISDKSLGDLGDRYEHRSFGNVFDQSEVTSYTASAEAAIHIYAMSNFSSDNDTFIGLRCPTHRVWHSVDLGVTPKNISFTNAKVYDHKFPVVVQVREQAEGVSVSGFDVFSMTNPESINFIESTACRFIDLYMSFNNGKALRDVNVKSNRIRKSGSSSYLAQIYKSSSSGTSALDGIGLESNFMGEADAVVRYRGAGVGSVTILGNDLPTMRPHVGAATTPPIIRSASKPLGGSKTYAPGPIAPGTYLTTTVPVVFADRGDYVVTPSDRFYSSFTGELNGAIIVATSVTSNNTVSVTFHNPTASSVTPTSGLLSVEKI